MPLLSNNVATFDSEQAKIEILEGLVKTSRVYSPILEATMISVPSIGSRIEWNDQKLGNDKVVLNGAYTAGSGTMTLDASTLVQPYSIKVGVHQLQTVDNSAIYNIVAYDSVNNTVTVTLDQGSDASLADNTTLFLSRNGQIGEDAYSTNDTAYSTTDYNYLSDFGFTIAIANPNKNGQLQYHFDEITFENQLENNIPEAMRTLERRIVKDYRVQGTGAATRNGNTIQSGNGSRAGGILTLGNARSMYTASTGTATISEATVETDMRNLRERGAFITLNERTRSMGLNYCKAYCSNRVISDVNKLTRVQRAPEAFYGQSDKIGGNAGTFNNTIIGDGVIVEYLPSDAMGDNEVLYVPQDELIQTRLVRLMEQQEPIHRGDNEVRMYKCSYSVAVKSPWLLGHRSNLVRN